MDGIAHIARQQQSQVASSENQRRVQEQFQQVHNTAQIKTKQEQAVDETNKTDSKKMPKLDSKEKVENLVKKLNDTIVPMSTSLKFGVDSEDIFYVSVIDTKTDKMIRRYPAEQAQGFLPKMQEVSGILFDSKG